MGMAQKQIIWPFFLIALLMVLMSPWPLAFFAPFLAMVYHRHSLVGSLWISAGCGIVIDLLSTTPFGIYSLNYAVVSLLLYRYRIYFVEKPIGLASLTLIFSIMSSVIARIFFFIIGISLPFTLKGGATDFLLLPLADGVYALLFFSCPLILYRLARRQWFRFLFFRKETKKKREEDLKTHAK